MVRITTQGSSGNRQEHLVPGTLADVGSAIGSAHAGSAYFNFPGRIGFSIRVAEIVAIELIEPARMPALTKTWFLGRDQS